MVADRIRTFSSRTALDRLPDEERAADVQSPEAASASLSTAEWLRQTYGPLLNLEQVAKVLDRKPSGVQHALSARRNLAWVQILLRGRRKIGRRTLYDAKAVAALIDGS